MGVLHYFDDIRHAIATLPVPEHCPISPVADGKDPILRMGLVATIPRGALRTLLFLVVHARRELNALQPNGSSGTYAVRARQVQEAAQLLERELWPNASSFQFVIEFGCEWKFGVTSLETIRLQHKPRVLPDDEQPREEGGLSFAYLDRPPEENHLSAYYALHAPNANAYNEWYA